jgi:hypothetical protein
MFLVYQNAMYTIPRPKIMCLCLSAVLVPRNDFGSTCCLSGSIQQDQRRDVRVCGVQIVSLCLFLHPCMYFSFYLRSIYFTMWTLMSYPSMPCVNHSSEIMTFCNNGVAYWTKLFRGFDLLACIWFQCVYTRYRSSGLSFYSI